MNKDAQNQVDNDKIIEKVTPWHEPVNLGDLLSNIVTVIRQLIVCSKETSCAAALWIVMTWFIDETRVAPLAVITAPEKRCGKSQFLTLIGKLVRNPMIASNITAPALFRTIDALKPTLLIDEADTFMRDNEELRGVLNCGHTRDSAYVIRLVGRDFTPKQFCVWGAKAVAGIGKLADTLIDRSIVLELRRKQAHEKTGRMRDFDQDFIELKSKLARIAQDYAAHIQNAKPDMLEELNDREQDNWEPLFAVADLAGGDWPLLARQASLQLSNSISKELSLGVELLCDIRQIFINRDRIKSEDLVTALCNDKEKPWATYDKGNNITPRQIAQFLKGFHISSDTVRFGETTAKGYKREWFRDAFDRYIPKTDVTKSQCMQYNGLAEDSMLPIMEEKVTVESNNDNECDVVTDFFKDVD